MSDSITPLKRCTKCGLEYPATAEYFPTYKKDASNPYRVARTGLCGTCRECDRERQRDCARRYVETRRIAKAKYYAENKEHLRALAKQWKIDNPEKNRELNRLTQQVYRKAHPANIKARSIRRIGSEYNKLSASDWTAALDYFDHCCAVCGRPAGLWHTIAADHWIPLSDPNCPGTIPTNIVPLCHGVGGCNNSKTNKPAADWLAERYAPRKAKQIIKRIELFFDIIKQGAI